MHRHFISAFFLLLLFFNSDTLFAQKNKLKIDPTRIEIVRDSFGVSHIFAPTDAEVAYGLAWATLEDDPETAQQLLLAAQGLLAKHMGVEGAIIDFAVQFMGVQETVEEQYENVPEDFKKVLEGFCAGVNAYAKAHPKDIWVKTSIPVKPQDVLAGYMLGLSLMGGVDGVIRQMVDGSIINQVPEEYRPEGIGSNSIAMNSSITADGQTYLAINSHQPLEGLLSWYEAHLHSEEGWNITGSLFHGGISIFHGTNEHLGWAHTVGELDKKDVFQLEMHPKKKNLYKFDGEWLKLEKERAWMKVALGKKGRIKIPVPKKYWTSVYGPTMKNDNGVFSLRMPSLLTIDAAEQWFRMNKATNFEEFKSAVEMQGISMMNICYADGEDNIYLLANGIFPKRADGYDWTKVVPGNSSTTLWDEYYDVDELAYFKNPKCGWVFNHNNSAFNGTAKSENLDPDDFDPKMGYRHVPTNRSLRFYELMDGNTKVDYEEFKKIKFDYTYPDSMCFRNGVDINRIFEIDPADWPEAADIIEAIKSWDRTADTLDTVAPYLFHSVFILLDKTGGSKAQQYIDDQHKWDSLLVATALEVKGWLVEKFGTHFVPLSKVQVLKRGDKMLPIKGGPDMLRAAYGNRYDIARLKVWVGDSFIQLVRFTDDGPIIESIHSYGASSRPESPHYNDQMEMFVKHQLKPRWLDKEVVYKHADVIYHPMD